MKPRKIEHKYYFSNLEYGRFKLSTHSPLLSDHRLNPPNFEEYQEHTNFLIALQNQPNPVRSAVRVVKGIKRNAKRGMSLWNYSSRYRDND